MGEYSSKIVTSSNLHNISKKIISLLVVFFLIATVFSSAVSAQDTHTLIRNIIGKNSDVQSDDSSKGAAVNQPALKTQLQDIFKELSMLRKAGTPIFSVVTKYNGTETTTRLKRFLPTTIDVDGDKDKDIRVWVFRLPGVDLRLPAACIKTTLLVRRLNDDIKYGPFEIYLQYAPKIISKLAGSKLDRIRIGYQSLAGEEVPDLCKVTYTYIPHIIYPRLKPVHKVLIDPGSITGKANLNLLFSIADMNDDNVSSQHIWNINYNPAVKTEVSIGRSRKGIGFYLELSSSNESKATISYTREEGGSSVDVGLLIDKLSNFKFQLDLARSSKGGSTIEYERLSSNPVNVTMFKENSNNFYFYVKNLPKHIKMSFIPESKGSMEINTYGEPVHETGFCDDLIDPSWRLYFSDLPTLAKLNWNLSKKKSLEAGNLTVYSDTECSVHLDALVNNIINMGSNAKVKLDVYPLSSIEMSISWNFKERYIRLDQSKTDLNLSLSVIGENGNTFEGSGLLTNLYDEPFMIFYDDLSDEEVNLSFVGKSFDVYNLDASIYLQKVGNFTLKMGHLKKNKNGNLDINLYVTKNGSYVNCNCSFAITGGIEVHDLQLGYNGLWYNKSYIIVNENDTLYFHFGGTFDVFFNIGDDLSWGYITIRGSIYVDVDFSFNSNGTRGMIKGKIYFKSNGESFNISWTTVDGKKRFTLDGRGLVGLSDFRLWFGDVIDISIGELAGSILLENASRDGGFFLFEFQGAGSLYINSSFSSKNESDVRYNVKLDTQVDTNNLPATIVMSWKERNLTMFKFNIGEGAYLNINDLDLQLIIDNKSLIVENLTSHLSGYLYLSLNRTINDSFISMKNADVFLHIDDYNNSGFGFDLGEVNISADLVGAANISFHNFTKQTYILPYYETDISWYNLTVVLDASQGIMDLNELYLEHVIVMNYSSTVSLKNISMSGYSKINLAFSLNETEVAPRFINICLTNSPGTNFLLSKSSFDLFLFDTPPIPITLYSGKLVGGIFEVHLRTFEIFSLEIINGSSIDYLDINTMPIRNNSDFHLNVSFDEPVNYLLFDVNNGWNDEILEYIFIDTHNMTTKVNISFTMPGIFATSKNVLGFRFDNVTLRADEFYLYVPNLLYDPANVSIDEFSIEGYLNLEGEGKIWMLIDGAWYPIDILGKGGSLAINPNHLRLKVDGELTLDHTISLGNGLSVTIAGTFVADNCTVDIWWNRTLSWTKLKFNGILTVEGFMFKVERDYNETNHLIEVSWDHFSLVIPQDVFIFVKISYFEVNVTSGALQIDNINVFIVNGQQTLSLSWSTFIEVGPSYLIVGTGIEPRFSISGSVNQVDVTDFYVNNGNKTIEIDFINLSGEFNFSTLPERTDMMNYLGLNISLNGSFEIDGITSNNANISRFDRVYFDGTGDIRFENWEDAQSNITIYLESQNGFIGQLVSIELDTGRVFEIAHLTSGNANVGPGYVNLSWNIDGDANGMVFLDSSSITLDNARISYWKPRHFGWGIRLGITDNFYADEWHLKWFPIHKTGHIYIGGVDIDITDGNQWYNIWPLFHPDEMNGESISLPYNNEYNLVGFNRLPYNI